MRAISTVLDVAVFLLLVSAAVGTVAYAPATSTADSSVEETAEVLATSTATVEYDIRHGYREDHGTLATLLGHAAVTNMSLDGTQLSSFSQEYRREVAQRTREILAAPNHTHIVAVWTPYRGSPITGRVAVGTAPPAGVDVAVATLDVPTSVAAIRDSGNWSTGGYDALSASVAGAVTATLLPATNFEASFGRESPTAVASASRFRTLSGKLGVSVQSALAAGNVSRAHDVVTSALARRLTADMAQQFSSPSAATATLRTGTVRITVQRWDP